MKIQQLKTSIWLLGLILGGSLCLPAEARRLSFDEAQKEPSARVGDLPIPGIPFGKGHPDPRDMGQHSYRPGDGDNGVLYTCRGGFIDLAHLRKAADWAAYLALGVEKALRDRKTKFVFTAKEPDRYTLSFDYPDFWDRLSESQRDELIAELSLRIGQELSFLASLWHEILTWHDYKATLIISEKPSAFSYDDMYSHSVGVYVMGEAFRDPTRNYDEAVTAALSRIITNLGGVQPEQTRAAMFAVKDLWWDSSKVWPMNSLVAKRSFDVGLEDQSITPWIIKETDGCNPADFNRPRILPNPSSQDVLGYDLEDFYTVEIKSKVFLFLNKAFPNKEDRPKNKRVIPERDLALIMENIRQEAKEELGEWVGIPYPKRQ